MDRDNDYEDYDVDVNEEEDTVLHKMRSLKYMDNDRRDKKHRNKRRDKEKNRNKFFEVKRY